MQPFVALPQEYRIDPGLAQDVALPGPGRRPGLDLLQNAQLRAGAKAVEFLRREKRCAGFLES